MLKKASSEVQVLELDGSEVHGKPLTKRQALLWSEQLTSYDKRGLPKKKSGSAVRSSEALYRTNIVKLVNVEDEEGNLIKEITSPDEIVSFLMSLPAGDASNKIDSWLLGTSELDEEEEKNSDGE
jgi:hypothetical protein